MSKTLFGCGTAVVVTGVRGLGETVNGTCVGAAGDGAKVGAGTEV
jgi:hypothetical protein